MHRDRSPAVAHAVCERAPTPNHHESSGTAPRPPTWRTAVRRHGVLLSAHLENCCPPTWIFCCPLTRVPTEIVGVPQSGDRDLCEPAT